MKKLTKEVNGGFTLIELMVVMAIIAVLATLIIGAIKLATDTSKETTHRSNSKAIQTALEANYAKYRRYCYASGDTHAATELPCSTTAGDIGTGSTSPIDTARGTLSIDITSTNECSGTQAGGGVVHVEKPSYWIRPFNAACNAALGGAAYDSNNDIRVGY